MFKLGKHMFGEGEMTFVILKVVGEDTLVARKIHINSDYDIMRHFPMNEFGQPIVGKNVFRELSDDELDELQFPVDIRQRDYLETLTEVELPTLDPEEAFSGWSGN